MSFAELVTKWDAFISALLAMVPELMQQPIIYAIVFLVVLVITALCALPAKKDRVNHNVLGLISYSFKILLGFIGSILTAIESITNFIDVVRVILRGKLTAGTQFLLSNYAIVALSVSSFYTTFNGLLMVSDWYISILITFGIQVGILAMSSKIALERNKGKERKSLQTITYEWISDLNNSKMYWGDDESKNNIQRIIKDGKEAFNNWQAERDPITGETNRQTESKKSSWISRLKKIKYYPILILCISVSSYFSYVHFYEKLVHPGAPMDNYMTAMNQVSNIVSSYSADLIEAQGVLQKYLQNYNAQIRNEYSQEIGEVQKKIRYQEELLQQIKAAEAEIMEIDRQIQVLERELSAIENEESSNTGTQEGQRRTAEEIQDEIDILIEYSLRSAQDRLKIVEDEYNTRQKEINDDSGYLDVQQIEKALKELDAFYVNPLYLESEGITEDLLLADLADLMEYEIAHTVNEETENIQNEGIEGGENQEETPNERYRSLSIVFNNYLELSRYYAKSGTIGMNPAAMEKAHENQERIISEYHTAVAEASKVKDNKEQKEAKENEEQKNIGNKKQAAAILNNETAEILMQMIGELNRIPVMEYWSDIQYEDQIRLNKLANHKYNEKLYDLYRIASGNISILEEAIRVRGTKGAVVSFLMVVMAVFVDFMTFVLTITKSVNTYENKLPLFRKIIYTIFFKEGFSEVEKHLAKVRRWVGGMSLAIGLLLFIVYDITSENYSNIVEVCTLFAMVMGSVLVGCLLIYVYERIYESRHQWKNENSYKELMTALNSYNVEREDVLRRKLDDCIDNDKDLILKPIQLKKLCELLETSDLEENDTILTQRAKSLFKNIEICMLSRITIESQYADREVSLRQYVKEGWQEFVYMAVLKEKFIKENHYNKEFAVLKSRELIYCVENNDQKYYVLSDLFMKILYDLIMEENSEAILDAELSFAEHISDYYEEQEIL